LLKNIGRDIGRLDGVPYNYDVSCTEIAVGRAFALASSVRDLASAFVETLRCGGVADIGARRM
jgi:hypothetical protein